MWRDFFIAKQKNVRPLSVDHAVALAPVPAREDEGAAGVAHEDEPTRREVHGVPPEVRRGAVAQRGDEGLFGLRVGVDRLVWPASDTSTMTYMTYVIDRPSRDGLF